jgi:hypothetical protein
MDSFRGQRKEIEMTHDLPRASWTNPFRLKRDRAASQRLIPNGRTIWIAEAHRGDGKRLVVRADEKLTASMELGSEPSRFTAWRRWPPLHFNFPLLGLLFVLCH